MTDLLNFLGVFSTILTIDLMTRANAWRHAVVRTFAPRPERALGLP